MGIKLRKASIEDAELLFNWANEEAVRMNSFTAGRIVYDNHVVWLKHKLQSDDCIIYIAFSEEKPIGQVRVDIEKDKAMIDYSVDRNYRGNGYGMALIQAIEDILKKEYPQVQKLAAQVKCSNKASLRVFEKLSFKESFIELEKKL